MPFNAKATKVGIAAALAGAAAMTAAGIAFSAVGGASSASSPVETGRTGVQLVDDIATPSATSSQTPSGSATADDWGNHAEPGDDHGGATPRDERTEDGDDHGTEVEPGDDHGRHGGSDDSSGRHGGHGSDD